MPTLFVSDLHLDATRPAATDAFVEFLRRDARRASTLFVLGDLFEAWIGDDDDSELAGVVADALAQLARAGTRCRFMHGNRDFLIGAAYAQRCGFELLAQSLVEDIEGVRTLVLHGDTLCSDDVAYQRFRAEVRTDAWQQQFLSGSLQQRRNFAEAARAESSRHARTAGAGIMDVNAQAVADAMQSAGVSRLVHGHTHRPAVHAFELDGEHAERIVLGDWYEQASVLELDAGRVQLRSSALVVSG